MSSPNRTQPIGGTFMPRLVARLHREGFDGTLRLQSGGSTRVVHFRRGDIASAASNAEEDRLPAILIREGRLTAPQLEMARSRQRPGISLGKTLTELGFLTPSELLQGARRQVRQILASCFALTDGTWQTVPGPLGPEVTNLGLPVRRLIFDALMEAGDRQAVVREMGSMESTYRPLPALADALPLLRLEPAMEEVARMIDGRATLREISGRTRLDDFTVSRIVLALEILGLAEMASRAEAAPAPRPGRVIPVEVDEGGAMADVVVQPQGPARDADARDGPTATPAIPARDTEPVQADQAPPDDGGTRRMAAVTFAVHGEPPAAPPAAGPGDTAGDTEKEIPLVVAPEAAPEPAAPDEPPPADGDQPPPADEPPPFPSDELPAFATDPRQELPAWEVNPQTGEKVHRGPIELTFDGPVAQGLEKRPFGRWALLGGVVIIVTAAALLTVFRPRAGDGGPPAHEEAAVAAAPDRDTHEPPAGGAESAGGDVVPPAASQASEPSAPAPSTTSTPETDLSEAEPSPARSAAVEPPVPEQPEPPADGTPSAGTGPATDEHPSPLPAGVDFAGGHALLDAGDVGGAAAFFLRDLAVLPPSTLSLQMLIACEDSTVLKARAATPDRGPLFVAPVAVKGRPCARLLWGLYEDREAAREAADHLPDYFARAGIQPVFVTVGRVRGTP